MLPKIDFVKCKNADFLLFDTDDLITKTLKVSGVWDEGLLKITLFFLKDVAHPLVLDIGANIGAYCVPLAKEIQNRGGFLSVYEPQRIVFYQLCGNIVINSLDNIFVYNIALGCEIGEVEIPEVDFFTNNNIGAFSLNKNFRELLGIEESMEKTFQKVEIRKLDDEVFSKEVDFIKIDVEGFEISVLKGGAQFLKTNNYPPILFEAWGFSWFEESKNELLSFIKSLGYEIVNLWNDDYIAQHPLNKIKVKLKREQDGVIYLDNA